MTNIHGIDPMMTGSKDYEKILEMLKNKQGTKVDDDELLFKTMQYYNLSGSSKYWSEDALELDVEELIEKWKEFDTEDTSFAKDFDEFDAYLKTYQKPTPPPEPPEEGGEVTEDTIIEFNGVRYEVYKKFNANPSETLKYHKDADGRTVFDSDGWNITVISSMNTTGDKNYANVVLQGNGNTFFGSNDDDTIEIRGNNNNIHGDALDIGGANDKITIASGTGNYIYGEDGTDEVDVEEALMPNNFFNKAYKDVEKVNGQNIFTIPDDVEPVNPPADEEPVDNPSENEEPAQTPASTVSPESPQYALTDDGVYHKYTLAMLGLLSEDGTAVPPSREDLAEFGIESEEDLENPALFEKIRRNSDLTEMLAPMETEVSEEDPEALTEVISAVTAQNVLDMYESCLNGDNKDKEWAAKMMALCIATGLIVLDEDGVAKIAEDKAEDTVDAKALFKLAMQMEE